MNCRAFIRHSRSSTPLDSGLRITQTVVLEIAIQFCSLRCAARLERKWRLRLAALCEHCNLMCHNLHNYKVCFPYASTTHNIIAVWAVYRKLVSTWSINCSLHVWCSCVHVFCCYLFKLQIEKKQRKGKSSAKLTFSCLKKHNIFSSLKTRFDETSDWKTLGSFLSATLRPSRGSVTALQGEEDIKGN